MSDMRPLILVSDDDADIRRILRFHLEDRGYDVLEAVNGADALEQVLTEPIDAMILDVMMPDLNGWEVLKYVRSKEGLKNLPILMLTGIGESLNSLTSPVFGASAHLDKPFDLDDIDRVLDDIMKGVEPNI